MRIRQTLMFVTALTLSVPAMQGAEVEVIMNNDSKVLRMTDKASGTEINVGEPSSNTYSLSIPAGRYVLTGIEADSTTVNGTLEVTVEDKETTQIFRIYTSTVTVSNTHADGTPWVEGEDYTMTLALTTQKGVPLVYTTGTSSTGRKSFITGTGDRCTATFTPSQEHIDEGYLKCETSTSFMHNSSIRQLIPMGIAHTVTVPKEATIALGVKKSHFIDFTPVEPKSEVTDGDNRTVTFMLAPSDTYNYRTSLAGKLTRAGYFKSGKDSTSAVNLVFAMSDYEAMDPAKVNHTVTANQGYETGDILVNGNERGHIALNVGDTFTAHAMRSWQLTDNSTGNYFMEPDFHYTVVGTDGKPIEDVIEITSKPGSAWADIKAKGEGTAIVLVTYDAIGVNYYSGTTRSPYMGGELWGAIWPENTAAYVVTVGQPEAAITPNMTVNADYNKSTLKVAGANVDAEHDTFYYLDTEEGYTYTFTPEGVADIEIARPQFGERMASYNGFTKEGVTRNADGSWSILLREGRQIVRMTDAAGRAAYQVMRARPCHREIVNVSNPGSEIFQPGESVKIQYSGLFHPANKLAGIYNMSAYVTYNGTPNGTSIILGAGQYTFGSAPSAQAVTVKIDPEHDIDSIPELTFTEGVIQVNGYGDPIGNHRLVDPQKGRDPNFNAQAHKTYFGAIPDARIKISPYKSFKVKVTANVDDAELTVKFRDGVLTPGADGLYEGTYGHYEVVASKSGYYCARRSFTVADDAEGLQAFTIEMEKAPANAWDGKTLTEPAMADSVYLISNGAELAWLAAKVNEAADTVHAELTADIELAGYDWTPIGNSGSTIFTGSFNGNLHRVSGIYVSAPKAQYQGLFGIVAGSAENPSRIEGVIAEGEVNGGDYAGGVAGRIGRNAIADRCASYVNVNGTQYSGGIAGYLFMGSKLTNSYNAGTVTTGNTAAGIIGLGHSSEVVNAFNVGELISGGDASAFCCRPNGTTATNVYALRDYTMTTGYETATEEQFASGEIAYRLGEAFGQQIGVDPYPVLGGMTVLYDADRDLYYNPSDAIDSVENDAPAHPVMYYNLEGTASAKPVKGFNLVRYSDGSVRKLFFRD